MLSTILPAQLTNIESLELRVNGTLIATATGPQPVSLAIPSTAITSALVVGINTIEATATAADNTVVTASTTLGVIDLALTPATATNDLTVDNTHTVLAKVTGDPSQIGGIPVAFAVTGQNVGATGTCNPVSCMTAANGEVSFTYTVPVVAAQSRPGHDHGGRDDPGGNGHPAGHEEVGGPDAAGRELPADDEPVGEQHPAGG